VGQAVDDGKVFYDVLLVVQCVYVLYDAAIDDWCSVVSSHWKDMMMQWRDKRS